MCLESFWESGHGLIGLRFPSFILSLSPSSSFHLFSLYLSRPHFLIPPPFFFFPSRERFPAPDLDPDLTLNTHARTHTHTHTLIQTKKKERKKEREARKRGLCSLGFFMPHSAQTHSKPRGSACSRHENLRKKYKKKEQHRGNNRGKEEGGLQWEWLRLL